MGIDRLAPVALALLAACEAPPAGEEAPYRPVYKGIETRLLDGELVNFLVTMEGARDRADVERYAECAAAQYTLIRGFGFARHLRTIVSEEGGLWRGDAVYTVSPALPPGLKTMDAEVTAFNCAENGIPMV